MSNLGALPREAGGLAAELLLVDGACDDFARHADQLFLVLDEAQANLLLRNLGVALHRLLLAANLLIAQVPEGGNDRREEQQHRDQRPECGEAVLLRGRLATPPATEQSTRQCG